MEDGSNGEEVEARPSGELGFGVMEASGSDTEDDGSDGEEDEMDDADVVDKDVMVRLDGKMMVNST